MEWISVSNVLPEKDISVLIYGKDVNIGTGYLWECRGELFWSTDSEDLWSIFRNENDIISHWMPLPDPPKQ